MRVDRRECGETRPLSRRAVMQAGLAAAAAVSLGPGLARAAQPSPRERLLATDTTDSLRLAIYQYYARTDAEMPTRAQVRQIADVYDMIQATNGPSLSKALHAARPDMILTEYQDLIWRYESHPDWDYITAQENFFAHSSLSPWPKQRIANPFFPSPGYGIPSGEQPHSWLLDPFDVDAQHPDRRDRWVNYYAQTSAEFIARNGMDGLLIDEAMNQYSPIPPEGYDETTYHRAIYDACGFVRKQLGDEKVIFWNGVQLDALTTLRTSVQADVPSGMPASLDLLDHLDGAIIEFFVTSYLTTGTPIAVLPQPVWEYTMNLCMEIQRRGGVLLAQSPIGADDRNLRMLTLTSFYLVKGARAYLHNGAGREFNKVGVPNWYPEWGIRLGRPVRTSASVLNYLLHPLSQLGSAVGVAYAREFEHGVVLANPSPLPAFVRLARPGYLARGEGGGDIPPDGALPAGDVTYTRTQDVQLPPNSGAIARWTPQAAGTHLPQRPGYGT